MSNLLCIFLMSITRFSDQKSNRRIAKKLAETNNQGLNN